MRPSILVIVLLFLPSFAPAKDYSIGNRDVRALAAAIEDANQIAGPHRIRLHPGGIYTLQAVSKGNLGLPRLNNQIRIDGRGAEIRRYSDERMTLIEVGDAGRVSLYNLTLAEGSLGAIRNRGELLLDGISITDSSSEQARGIVLNYGRMRVKDSLFGYNRVTDHGRDCGVLINLGHLEIENSEFMYNSLSRSQPAVAAGAVLNFGRLKASNLTFSKNRVSDPSGALTYQAVVNLDSGSFQGLEPGYVIDERNDLSQLD